MKRLALLLSILSLFFVSACSGKVYEQEIEAAIGALQEQQYKEALSHLRKAEKAKATDEVKQYIQATEYMEASAKALREEKFADATSYAKKVISLKDTSKAAKILKPQAQQVIAKIEALEAKMKEMNEKLEKARMFVDERKFAEAEAILKELAGTTSDDEQIRQIAKEAGELWRQVDLEKRKAGMVPDSPDETQEQPLPKPTPKAPLTPKQAEDLVRAYMKIPKVSNYIVQYEMENEAGHYIIHVYEEVSDPNFPHNATIGWYAVNPRTREISNETMR
ncbi:MAG: hypothetical protein ACE3JP_16330 [Ectobacillus sp.]